MFKLINTDGVYRLVSDIIPAPHAFSTRIGGASTLPQTAEMNFGSSIDDPCVDKNIDIFTSKASLPQKTVRVKQIHSNKIAVFTSKDDISRIDEKGFFKGEGDGFFTTQEDISLCVRTADCLPIILSSKDGRAVAALHAGWRGSVMRIAEKAVDIFKDHGIPPCDIYAALGPCIDLCCFEVGDDFVENFSLTPSAHLKDMVIKQKGVKYFCDLKKLNSLILEEAGLLKDNIDICDRCTHHDPHLFFSHRLTSFERGTMGNLVAVKKG